jgi:cell division protein FtsZ
MTINSLIHRMTGQVGREDGPLRPRVAPPASRPTARPEAAEDYENTDRERVDIPAFLRRQAN